MIQNHWAVSYTHLEILKASRNNKCSDIHISANTGIKVRQDGLLADYPIEFPQNELIKMIMELIPKRLIDNVDRHEDADFVYNVGEERYLSLIHILMQSIS